MVLNVGPHVGPPKFLFKEPIGTLNTSMQKFVDMDFVDKKGTFGDGRYYSSTLGRFKEELSGSEF